MLSCMIKCCLNIDSSSNVLSGENVRLFDCTVITIIVFVF